MHSREIVEVIILRSINGKSESKNPRTSLLHYMMTVTYYFVAFSQDIPCAVKPDSLISAGPGYAGLPACLSTQ